MSRPIDEKIVSIKLENDNLKKNAADSLSVFGKLQQAFGKVKSVDMSRSVESLADVGRAADNVDMGRLSTALEGVSQNFSALNIMAITALTNITNRAVNAGLALARNLTLKPMQDGFAEYELKLGSIQTILANTSRHGTTLDDVTKSLDTLNEYADKTIYNFGDMTKNIGLFTNAGLGIEESTSMIKGFSNEAAASGTTAQGAAGAAYQLSQALSAGTIRLMDWRSLTNVGMGNKNMQNGLIEIADAMGMVSASGLTATEIQNDFNGSLENEWLSADVMSKYLQIMAGDMDEAAMATLGLTESQIEMFVQQAKTGEEAATKVRTFTQLMDTLQEALGSGWTETMELIFGDFYEATELWTGVSNAIGAFIDNTSKARNELLGDFVKLGGRKAILDSIVNTFKALGNILGPVGKVLADLIPPVTARTLMDFANRIKILSQEFLKISGPIGKGAAEILSAVISVIRGGIGFVLRLGDALVDLFPRDFAKVIENAYQAVVAFISGSRGSFKDFAGDFKTWVSGIATAIFTMFENLDRIIEGIFSNSMKGGTGFADFITDVMTSISEAMGKVWEFIQKIDFSTIFSAGLLVTIMNFAKSFAGIKDSLGGFMDSLLSKADGFKNPFSIFESLSDSLSDLTTSVKTVSLTAIATSIFLIAGALKMMEGMDIKDITEGLGAISGALYALMTSLKVISGLNLGLLKSGAAVALIGSLAISIVILAGALKVIESVDPERLGSSLMALASMIAMVTTALFILSKSGGKIQTSALFLVGLSVSIRIMVGAVSDLADLDVGQLKRGLTSLGIILLELAIFLRIADGAKLKPTSAVGLLITVGAVKMMVTAINDIADIKTDVLVKGLSTIGAILLELAIFSRIARGGSMMASGLGLIIVAQGIKMLVEPIESLGALSLEELAKGVGAIAVALVSIGLAMKLVNPATIIFAGTGLVIVAQAIKMLVDPIKTLGQTDIEELAVGIGAIAAAMLVLGTASRLMSLGGSVGLIAAAIAIKILVPPLLELSKLSFKEVAVGLTALAGAFLVIGASAVLLSAASLSLIAFGAGIALVGAGVALVGVGLFAFATGLATLSGITVAAVAGIIKVMELLLKGLTTMVPLVIDLVLGTLVGIISAIADYLPELLESGISIVMTILQGIADNIYQFVSLAVEIVTELARALGDNIQPLLDTGAELIIDLINGMAETTREKGPEFVDAVTNMMGAALEVVVLAFLDIVNAIFWWIPGVTEATDTLGKMATNALRDAFGIDEVGDEKGRAFVDNVEKKRGAGAEAGRGLGQDTKNALDNVKGYDKVGGDKVRDYSTGMGKNAGLARNQATALGGETRSALGRVKMDSTGRTAGQEYTRGVSSKNAAARNAGRGLSNNAQGGAREVSLHQTGVDLAQGLANGISSMVGSVSARARELAYAARNNIEGPLQIMSPSRVMRKDGAFIGEGLGLGIQDMIGYVAGKSKKLATAVVDTIHSYSDMFSDELIGNMDMQPVITPVLDMSNMDMAMLEKYDAASLKLSGLGLSQRDIEPYIGNSNTTTSEVINNYTIQITANGELPTSVINKMADKFETAIKNKNDRAQFNRGEFVTR